MSLGARRLPTVDDYFDTKYRPNAYARENRFLDSDEDASDVINYFSQTATQRRLDALHNLHGVSERR